MDAEQNDGTAVFEEHRPVLLGVAYRMLGRVADAEDVVQDTWLRWASADRQTVREPRAFLVRVATRLALDRLRSAQSRRETYVGPWLPEPLPTDVHTGQVPDGAERAMLAESVSLAVLVVLESLSPLERAVFVLREAFGFPHEEIAGVLDRSPAAVRKLAARARTHVAERTPRYEVDPDQQRELTRRFMDAASRGDLDGLLRLLAPDARLVGDGGGKAKAPLRTITSSAKVGRFMAAIAQQGVAHLEFAFTELNGAAALVGSDGGKPTAVMLLDVADGRIQCVYLVANPDKLTHLRTG
ncbi:RNA polymerase sigma-70 factor [Streptomyces marispadix]|nr:RNA polymerase sigma-70 factor [Streptomyces marispadix]